MKCSRQDCTSNHGFVTYYYNVNDQNVYWFCSRAHKKHWCDGQGIPDFMNGRGQ